MANPFDVYYKDEPESGGARKPNPFDRYYPDETPSGGLGIGGNPVTNLGKGLVRGVTHSLPKQLAQASQQLGIGGRESGDFAQELVERGNKAEEEAGAPGMFEQAGEMIPSSIGIPAALYSAGLIAKAIPTVPTQIASPILMGAGKVAGLVTPAVFGLSQAEQTRSEAIKRGVDPGSAPLKTGTIEWLGETVGNYALLKAFGPLGGVAKSIIGQTGAKQALKGTVLGFLKQFALVTAPTEILTEMGQNYGEALVEKHAGIRPEANPWNEAVSAIGPTAIMTALVGGGGQMLHRYAAAKAADTLATPVDGYDPNNLTPEAEARYKLRLAYAKNVSEVIPKENEALRQQWLAYAQSKIDKNLEIDITSPMDSLAMQTDMLMDTMPEERAAIESVNIPAAITGAGTERVSVPGEKQIVDEGKVEEGQAAADATATERLLAAIRGDAAITPEVVNEKVEEASRTTIPAVAPEVIAAENATENVAPVVNEVAPEASVIATDNAIAPENVVNNVTENVAENATAPAMETAGPHAGIPAVFVGMSDENLTNFIASNPTNQWAQKEAEIRQASVMPAAPITDKEVIAEPAAAAPAAPAAVAAPVAAGVPSAPAVTPASTPEATPVAAPTAPGPALIKTKGNAVTPIKNKTQAKALIAAKKAAAPKVELISVDNMWNKTSTGDLSTKDGVWGIKRETLGGANPTYLVKKNGESYTETGKSQDIQIFTTAKAAKKFVEHKINYEATAIPVSKTKAAAPSAPAAAIPAAGPTTTKGKGATALKEVIAAKKEAAPVISARQNQIIQLEKSVGERARTIQAMEKQGKSTVAIQKAQSVQQGLLNKLRKEEEAAKRAEVKAKVAKEVEPLSNQEEVDELHDSIKLLNKQLKDAVRAYDESVRLERPERQQKLLAQTRDDIKKELDEVNRELKKITSKPSFTRSEAAEGGVTVARAQGIVDKVLSYLKNPPKVQVLESMNSFINSEDPLGKRLKAYMEEHDMLDAAGEDNRTVGFTWEGQTYIIAGNNKTPQQVVNTLTHELTHMGLGRLLSSQKGISGIGSTKLKYEILMDRVYSAHPEAINEIAKTTHQHLNIKTTEGKRKAAEEWLCNQSYEAQPKWYDKLVAIFREALRKIGIDAKMSDSEVRVILQDAFREFGYRAQDLKFARKGKQPLTPEDKMWMNWEPEMTATDNIKGAPEWVTSQSELKTMRAALRKFSFEGLTGRHWYEDSLKQVMKIAKGDVVKAEKFIQLLSIYSPNSDVWINTLQAVRAYTHWSSGKPESSYHVGMDKADKKAIALLYHNEDWAGRKTNSFYQNLMHDLVVSYPEEVNKLNLDPDFVTSLSKPVTIDVWMGRAFGYLNAAFSDDKGAGKYSFSENEIRRLTARLNSELAPGEERWLPHQVQATIWTAVKTRYETKSVKEKTNRKSLREGLIGIDNRGNVNPKSAETGRQHLINWRHFAMQLSSDEVIKAAENNSRSFGDDIQRMTNVVTWEANPSTKLGYKINNASASVLEQFTADARNLLIDENGNDVLAWMLGVPLSYSPMGYGAYANTVSPNVLSHLLPARGKGEGFSVKEVRAYARAIQYIFKQDAVPWFRPDNKPLLAESAINAQKFKVINATGKVIRTYELQRDAEKYAADKGYAVRGGDLARASVITFDKTLDNRNLKTILSELQNYLGEEAGFTRTANNEITIVNYRDDETKVPFVYDEDFTRSLDIFVKDSRQKLGIAGSQKIWVEGEYGNVKDWSESTEQGGGRDILDAGSLSERPDIHPWLRDRRDAFDALLEEYGGKGTTAPSFARTAERRGPAGQQSVREGFDRVSGRARIDAGAHYSKQERTRLDSKFYGTGLSDATSMRLPMDPKSPLRHRIYFYYDTGNGMPNPERGVGAFKHDVDLSQYNIYDLTSNVIKITPVMGENVANTLEMAILKAGFDGFSNPNYGIAVLLGKRVVPVQPVKEAPKFDRAAGAAIPPGNGATWNAPVKSLMNKFWYTMVDKHVDLRDVTTSIEKFAGAISDTVNASLKETLFSGRVAKRVENFLDGELKPVLKDLAAANIDLSDFEEYLHYRHAKEANDYVKTLTNDKGEVIGMQDGGSGKTYEQIKNYNAALDPALKNKMEPIAEKVDAMTRENARLMVEYSLESQDTIDKWFGTYQHYVPLFRQHVAEARIGTGSGLTVTGSITRKRKGSPKPVVNVLANIANQRERVISSGEKNIIATALYGLAKMHPNPEFWETIKPGVKKRLNVATGEMVWTPDDDYKKKDNVVMSRQLDDDGKIVERGVEFSLENDRARRMADSIRNIDMDNLGLVLSTSAKVTRFIASMNTQYNPIFGVTNFVRDVGTAMFNLTTTPIAGRQKEVMSHAIPALMGIYSVVRSERAGRPATGEWAKLFNEFQEHGGQTGYRDLFRTTDERSRRLEREIRMMQSGKAIKLGMGMFNWLSDYNTAMENSIRLSAYKVGIDRGMTKDQAAAMAKGLTVNFNRKGQIATQAGALYAFFNASAQGAAKVYETLTGPTGKRIIAGGILFGVMQAAILAAAGMDEDEPPEFVQEKNIIIPIGGGKYITIPMPLGFNVLPNIGRMTAQFAMGGFKQPFKKMSNLFGVILDGFNPLGASKTLLQTISPTPIDPLVALAENKDWTGKPIYREDFSSLHPTPGFTRTKDTATWGGKALSWGLNMLTGGTRATPGFFSPTPDQIDYLVGQATGGVGREAAKIQQGIAAISAGEEIPSYKIPLGSRFFGSITGKSYEGTKYYENLKLMNKHEDEIKDLREHRESTAEYYADNPEAKLWMVANRSESSISKLNKRKREMQARGASPASIKAIDAMIYSHMKRLNEVVEAARE